MGYKQKAGHTPYNLAFGVERICTCERRGQECQAQGYHLFETSDSAPEALHDAAEYARETGVNWRVCKQSTGEVLNVF